MLGLSFNYIGRDDAEQLSWDHIGVYGNSRSSTQ